MFTKGDLKNGREHKRMSTIDAYIKETCSNESLLLGFNFFILVIQLST
jgi:hypothetical protein